MRHRHAPIFLAVLISDKSDMAFFIRLLAALCWMAVVGVASTSIPLPYIIMAWYPKVMFVASLNSLHSLFTYYGPHRLRKAFLDQHQENNLSIGFCQSYMRFAMIYISHA